MRYYIEVCLFVKRIYVCQNTSFDISNDLDIIIKFDAMHTKFAG